MQYVRLDYQFLLLFSHSHELNEKPTASQLFVSNNLFSIRACYRFQGTVQMTNKLDPFRRCANIILRIISTIAYLIWISLLKFLFKFMSDWSLFHQCATFELLFIVIKFTVFGMNNKPFPSYENYVYFHNHISIIGIILNFEYFPARSL